MSAEGEICQVARGLSQIAIGPPIEQIPAFDLSPGQEYQMILVDDEPDEIGAIHSSPPASTYFVIIAGHFSDVFGKVQPIRICLAEFGNGKLTPYPYSAE